MITKDQLAQLADDVRLPAELLFERLKELKFPPASVAANGAEGLAVFFEREVGGLVMTADIEIESDGTISASIIPYLRGPDGLDLFQDPTEPIDIWEVEEEPPFEESLTRIRERLNLPL
jgi:hypothetical protein